MFLLGLRRFRRMGPLGLAFAGYQMWRRLPPEQRAAIAGHASAVANKLRGTSPSVEITPADLTSPGTVPDPDLEEERAKQAVARERESRQSEVTKFEEQRLEQEAERAAVAPAVAEAPLTDVSGDDPDDKA